MMTFFTCPKAFTDPHIRVIQRNAIESWMRLRPACEILLVGDDDGVKEAAAEFGLRHIPSVERNARGTPLVSSVFEKAQAAASHALLAYVNTDIILGPDFQAAASRCQGLKPFLLIGRRWDLDISAALDFGNSAWYDKLCRDVHDRGKQHGPAGLDYFVFRKGLWSEMPPFALGRCAWDNWLVYRAAVGGARLVDGSQAVTAIHQNHDYVHSGHANANELWRSEEAERNRILAGGVTFDVLDCGYRLEDGQLQVARDRDGVLRRMERFQEYRPLLWKLLVSWKIRSFVCFLSPLLGQPCGKRGSRLVEVNEPFEFHGSSYGGFPVVHTGLSAGSLVYSCGVGEDISFDLSLIRKYGLRVFAFDPTPRSIEWVRAQKLPSEFQFFGHGIADFDGEAEFHPPENSENVSHSLVHGAGRAGRSLRVEVKRLESILKLMGHHRIDILKLDIEGAEFDVLEDVIRSRIPVGQIVVEFHHRFPEAGRRRLLRIRRVLREAGFRVFYASEDDRQYGFIKV